MTGSPRNEVGSLRLAYADPPYPGCAHLYRGHPDYAGEVDHVALIGALQAYDGWALSTSAASLRDLLPLCPDDVRVLAWVKNTVNVAWEPVIAKAARPISAQGPRDWIRVEAEAFNWRPKPDSYVIGQKPVAFCKWMFGWLGAQPGDSFDDLFPGSGAVGRAWDEWSSQPQLLPAATRSGTLSRARRRMLAEHPTLLGDQPKLHCNDCGREITEAESCWGSCAICFEHFHAEAMEKVVRGLPNA